MAVTVSIEAATGLFVPYRTAHRGGPDGSDPVGTLAINAEAVGAAGGGVVNIFIVMNAEEFGFPLIYLPTAIEVSDNLATAEVVYFAYTSDGNDRLQTSWQEAITTVAEGVNSRNLGFVKSTSIPIDSDGVSNRRVLNAAWPTNTDTKVYHLHTFGPVWDGQLLAKAERLPEMLAGLR